MAIANNRSTRSLAGPIVLTLLALLLVSAIAWSIWIAERSDVPWSELIPAIVGGTIGALAGGIPAYFLALRSSKEVLERDQHARVQQERADAFRAHVRVGELVNGILSLQMQIEEMVQASAGMPHGEVFLWVGVRPIAGLADEGLIAVQASEAALFVAAGAEDYVNDLLLLPKRYKAVVSALLEYRRLRDGLTREMPVSAFEGDIGSTYLTKDQLDALMPRMIELNSIIAKVRSHLAKDRETALRLARDFAPIMKRYFKVEKFPGFTLEQDDESQVDRQAA